MCQDLIARASVVVNAPKAEVWNALINPAVIKQYLFGTNVISEWKKGSRIVWKGEWQGKEYEDKGEILEIIPGERLTYSYFSSFSGKEDKPENYLIIEVVIHEAGPGVQIRLIQKNNRTEEEREHSEKNWITVLDKMKKIIESKHE